MRTIKVDSKNLDLSNISPEYYTKNKIMFEGVQIEFDYLEYLDMLRNSGMTNMFGAAPYLAESFNISKTNARKVLEYWMCTFSARHNKEDK